MPHPAGLTLFIDADDTLWENNIHFDDVVRVYCDLVEARGVDRALAWEVLLQIERRRTKTHGYGIACFRASLHEACATLLGAEVAREQAALTRACRRLARVPITLLDDVIATLRELAGRHRVILLTKGDRDDQLSKLTRSPVGPCFHEVDVVGEKDRATYDDARHRFGVRDGAGWMVGNSPKSDIAPALEAGLGAVFIPHRHTWILEQADLPPGDNGRLLVLERFGQLREHF